MRRAGWVVFVAGLLWAVVGADNVLNDSIAGWKFHHWEMASRSLRENGSFYGIPGALVMAVGAIILVREWWKRL
jgi:predicted tellurium resistance membrane protein TerC